MGAPGRREGAPRRRAPLPPAPPASAPLAAAATGFCAAFAAWLRVMVVCSAVASPCSLCIARLPLLPPLQGRSPLLHPALAPLSWVQISSKEEPRHYSAKIAWNARNNSHMPLLATGAPAINCAIKVGAASGRPRSAGRQDAGSVAISSCVCGTCGVPVAAGRQQTASPRIWVLRRRWRLRGGCWRKTAWSSLCSRRSGIGTGAVHAAGGATGSARRAACTAHASSRIKLVQALPACQHRAPRAGPAARYRYPAFPPCWTTPALPAAEAWPTRWRSM